MRVREARLKPEYALSGIAFLLALTIALKPMPRDLQSLGAPGSDFALAVYYPVRAFLDGSNPYDQPPYLASYPVPNAFAPYLPSTLVLHLPFAFVDPGLARAWYLVIAICLTLVLAFLSLKLSGVKVSTAAVLLLGAAVVLSRPGRQNLLLGQVTLELVLATYMTLYYAHSAPRLSGLGLSLALTKLSYGGPLALLLLMRGHRRAVAYAGLCVLLLNVPVGAILAYRAGGVSPFTEQLSTTFGGFQAAGPANNPVISPYRIDAVALLARFVGQPPDLAGQLLVTLAILGLAAVANRRLGEEPDSLGVSAGLNSTAVLLCVYHQNYDLLLLTMPFVWAASRGLHRLVDSRSVRITRVVLFTFLAVNYTASDSVLRRLGFLTGGEGLEALVSDPRARLLASLNGLALLSLFCALVVTVLATPTRQTRQS